MGANYIYFYWMLIVAMVLWMAIRIAKVSTGMAFASFVCWPIAVIPLITNWGQRDSDIRLQFLVTAVASILLWNASGQIVEDHPSLLYTQEEIEEIRASDPVFAAEMERDQSRAVGIDIEALPDAGIGDQGRVDVASHGPRAFVSPAEGPGAVSLSESDSQNVPTAFAAAPAKVARVPLRELNFRRGNVRLGAAWSRIQLPQHFRFIARHQLV